MYDGHPAFSIYQQVRLVLRDSFITSDPIIYTEQDSPIGLQYNVSRAEAVAPLTPAVDEVVEEFEEEQLLTKKKISQGVRMLSSQSCTKRNRRT